MVEFPAGLARLADLDERGTEAEAVAEADVGFVEACGRDILTERAWCIQQRRIAQMLTPRRIMIGRIMVDRLVDAAMDGAIGLLVAGQPLWKGQIVSQARQAMFQAVDGLSS